MKLTLQLKLLPTSDQHTALLETMHAFNAAASYAARVGFEAGVFTQLSIHRRCYRELRDRFGLSSQMAVRAIGKAVEVFKRDRTVCPVFRADGAMTYDHHLLAWKGPTHVSLLTLQGRQRVAMIYGEYQAGYMDRLSGQVDLVYRQGQWYLYATIVLPDPTPIEPTDFLGVDLGVINLATTSDGTTHSRHNIYDAEHREERRAKAQERRQRNPALHNERARVSKRKNWEEYLAKNGEYNRATRANMKFLAIQALGGCCMRCGYSADIRALQIDHINSDGKQDRQTLTWYMLYKQVAELGGQGRYQVLCANCNQIKRMEAKEHPPGRTRAE